MSPTVTAPEFEGVISGGEALGGHFAYLVIRLGGKDVQMLIEKSRVGEFITGLATAAGMAAQKRLVADPTSSDDSAKDHAYALKLDSASVGRSTDGRTAILVLKIDAQEGREMEMFLAADEGALVRLRAACARAMDVLNQGL